MNHFFYSIVQVHTTINLPKNYSVTKEELEVYMEGILKRTNICTADEDGTTGDVVAAYKNDDRILTKSDHDV